VHDVQCKANGITVADRINSQALRDALAAGQL
jgi:hypothetical protein